MASLIVDFIKQKMEFVRDHGKKLSEELEFSFNEDVDLCVTGEET